VKSITIKQISLIDSTVSPLWRIITWTHQVQIIAKSWQQSLVSWFLENLQQTQGRLQGVCFAVMTGSFVLQVVSIKVNKISNAVTAGLQCRCLGTSNSISLLTLHSTIIKQQRACLV